MRAAPLMAAVLALLAAGTASAQAPRLPPPGASSCSGCHGTPASAPIPSIQGRSADQIATALKDFRDGRRQASVMDRIAKGFDDAEIAAIAAWYGEAAKGRESHAH